MGHLSLLGGGADYSGLPSGYTRLAYIESSGTQYIDTGFMHNQNTRVVMKVKATEITANAWAFEGRTSSSSASSKGLFFYYSSSKKWCADYSVSGGSNRASFSGISDTDLLEIDYNKNVCTINDVSNTWTESTFQSTVTLCLLAANTGGTVAGYLSAKLYSCQIYDNDVLIRDYVPCLSDADGVGLYDLVEGKFYGNAGTGTFIGSEVA